MTRRLKVTPADVYAAKAKVELDKQAGRTSEPWVLKLSKADLGGRTKDTAPRPGGSATDSAPAKERATAERLVGDLEKKRPLFDGIDGIDGIVAEVTKDVLASVEGAASAVIRPNVGSISRAKLGKFTYKPAASGRLVKLDGVDVDLRALSRGGRGNHIVYVVQAEKDPKTGYAIVRRGDLHSDDWVPEGDNYEVAHDSDTTRH